MKKIAQLCAIALFAASAIVAANNPMVGGHEMFPSKNIVQNALNSDDHTTLVAAVKAAGLVDTLEGSGPFTVFAPTNEAFAKLPAGTVDTLLMAENKATLTKVLTYHVVAGKMDSKEIAMAIKAGHGKAELNTVSGGKLWASMQGKDLILTDEKGGTARVTISNVYQSNGVKQAERFGLSQLHQLRGRVGRGAEQSYCMLVTEKLNDAAKERIRALVDSQDGFAIAETDLKLRGPGEFFGTKQSGLPSLLIANILRDPDILSAAKHEARSFVERPPSHEALLAAVEYIRGHWQRRYGLVQVG